MDNFKYDNLEIISREENGIMTLSWHGSSDARNPVTALAPYLESMLDQSENFEFCAFDFAELEFMNSSTIAAILHVVEKMKNHPAQFQLIFSEQKDWQDFNFRMMKFVTRNVSNITIQKK